MLLKLRGGQEVDLPDARFHPGQGGSDDVAPEGDSWEYFTVIDPDSGREMDLTPALEEEIDYALEGMTPEDER